MLQASCMSVVEVEALIGIVDKDEDGCVSFEVFLRGSIQNNLK